MWCNGEWCGGTWARDRVEGQHALPEEEDIRKKVGHFCPLAFFIRYKIQNRRSRIQMLEKKQCPNYGCNNGFGCEDLV